LGPYYAFVTAVPVPETPPSDDPSAQPTLPPDEMDSRGFIELAGRLLDNRYQIERKLGEGGMCFVYLARDTESGERVAIKILLPALIKDPVSMALLRREAALGSRLSHPNVCHIIRLGETRSGFDYLVMPFVEGELLCDRTRRAGQLELDVAAGFVRDMCAGLNAAHEIGIIHRDLKPENVMIVAQPDGSHRAVVMDFSLAKDLRVRLGAEPLTGVGLVMGTPEFMSPEQLRGDELDARSDIYSLAFMVYEMLTGLLPFEGPTPQKIMVARLRGDSMPIRTKRPDLHFSRDLEEVLATALAREPEERYASALEFGDAFCRAAAGAPLPRAVKTAGLLGRIEKRLRRREDR
jgi:eukaryotic-like serine/threonine-protein kinase